MKENDGRGARRKLTRQAMAAGAGLFILVTTLILMGVLPVGTGAGDSVEGGRKLRDRHSRDRNSSGQKKRGVIGQIQMTAEQLRQSMVQQFSKKNEATLLQEIADAKLDLVDLTVVEEELLRAPTNSYAGVYGKFCKLDWTRRKIDPSAVPMFRDLVAQSDDCQGNLWTLDLHKIAELVRTKDASTPEGQVPKVLNFTAAVFHESRCGSTLVANAVAAMDTAKHRSYSESQPPAAALNSVCGNRNSRCSKDQAAKILRDVVYLMSRSDDPNEERVFFKFQSATTKNIPAFQLAFPDVPWMFVYRDPVQVMMSHVKDDATLQRALCTRSRLSPPQEVRVVAKHHGKEAQSLKPEEYCAAHLAAITESAVSALNDKAIPVLYDGLPDVLHQTILPKIFGRDLTTEEVTNIKGISQQYSKGRGTKHQEFHEDSQRKEKAASEKVRQAADLFLQESYDQLFNFEPKLLSE